MRRCSASNIKYYDDCSSIIRLYFLKKLADRCARNALHAATSGAAAALRQRQQNLEQYLAQQQRRCPHGSSALPELFWIPPGHATEALPPSLGGDASGENAASRIPRCLCMALESEEEGDGTEEELRTVVVVMRHGDRRPKQKLKFLSTQPLLLQYFSKQASKKELKLKSPEELRDLLDRNTDIITALGRQVAMATQEQQTEKKPPSPFEGGDASSVQQRESSVGAVERQGNLEALKAELRLHKQLQKVLLQGDGFAGINRKIQLKPKRWGRGHQPDTQSSVPCSTAPLKDAAFSAQQQQEETVMVGGGSMPQVSDQLQQIEFGRQGSAMVLSAASGSTPSVLRTCSVPLLTSPPLCMLSSPAAAASSFPLVAVEAAAPHGIVAAISVQPQQQGLRELERLPPDGKRGFTP
ncbi:inositol hexakisphosphate and diphosphoinositol-pentakisphosphate [Cyclospora cayetanensis]|uniref:Inositol hexakisphosphate and diphosphoinositol-pentakisphosphate kinase n=1 Tax=Cyclospora cayetanensis TaxID=88456 RepID=A0A1D3D0Q0_9EIME|nr:inositol hexakisphosphate and diphosphoinositol-pentakisphosphate [Cyclospora cayetanensis]